MRQIALAALVLAMVPTMGIAQDSNDTWSDIQRMTEGRAVRVTVGRDTRISGTFLRASGDTVIVRRAGTAMTIDRASVRTIKVQSPSRRTRNMILFGALGAVAGAVPGAMLDELFYNETGRGGAAAPLLGALGAGIGLVATRNSGYHSAYSAKSAVQPLGAVVAFDQLGYRIGPGDKIDVAEPDGGKLAGTVERMSSTSISIRSGGKRYELRSNDVKSITQRMPDSLVNGTMWGMLTGAGLALGGTATQAGHLGYGSRRGDYLVSAAIGGGIGAGAGAVIDALHKGKKVVYARPAEPKTASLLRALNFAPVISKNRKGAAVSLSF